MQSVPRKNSGARFLAFTLLCGGCSLASATRSTLEALEAGVLRHPDPVLVREALPAYLLLLDALLAKEPDDPALLRAATVTYVRYCQAFLVNEEDTQRALKLYTHAREYGLRLLSSRAFFHQNLHADLDQYRAALDRFAEEDVPDLYAAGSAWLGWIIAGGESMAALAELPRALALMQRAMALDSSYGDGAGHLVFGLYYAVQPSGAGQNLPLSRQYFQDAIELAGSGNVLPRVIYAEYYGRATLDRELFTKTLEEVLTIDVTRYTEHRLTNELARERAVWLLEHCDEFF